VAQIKAVQLEIGEIKKTDQSRPQRMLPTFQFEHFLLLHPFFLRRGVAADPA